MPKYSLMAHQVEGVKFLDSMDGVAALLWEPGVGKTGATLTWIDKMAQRHGDFRVLVVSPKTAADTWVLQAPPFMDSVVKSRVLQGSTLKQLLMLKAAGTWRTVPPAKIMANHKGDPTTWPKSKRQVPRVTIMSMSAGAISSFCKERKDTVKVIQAVRKYAPHLIVVDESHIIKSATANLSTAMYALGQLAPHRIILTGTVSPHSPLDVYGQWRFMAPWTFSDQHGAPYTASPTTMTTAQIRGVKPWTWKRFTNRYAEMGGYEGKVVQGVSEITETELHDRVAERSMVVLKEDALDLPPVTDVDVHVELSPRERKAYDDMRDELAAEMESGELVESPNALAKIMKLRQITAGFVRDSDQTSATYGETFVLGNSKRAAVKEVVNVRLAGEDRIVVFAYFQSECAAIAADLAAKGRTVEVVTGKTNTNDRLAIRKRFGDVSGNPEQIVLVAQARTMSLSVNELVTAKHAVYASLSERRDDWIQSRGRLDRNGQTANKVTFWRVFVPGTVDQVQLGSYERKGSLEKGLIDHIRSTPR